MSSPPDNKHRELRERLRAIVKQLECFGPKMPMHIPIGEVTMLLDLLTEQDNDLYSAWEHSMGDDL